MHDTGATPTGLTYGATYDGSGRGRTGREEAVRGGSGHDLTAAPGEVTALVGPNGAGKTTLLLVLATLLVPDAGQVTVAGFDPVMQADGVRAQMGWAPDVFGLYDNLTCREYLVFCGEAMRLAAAKARTRAWELLAVASLTEQADQPVHTLSRSQKQRLGLTRSRLRNHMPSRTRAIEHPVTRPSHSVTQALAGFVRCKCAIRASPPDPEPGASARDRFASSWR